ncbi:Clavaminate synthase-like protein [Xylariaceae sp. FL0255]|nr:Clavaminate synthase-like protein [Xylariaceae sp. FL0255]
MDAEPAHCALPPIDEEGVRGDFRPLTRRQALDLPAAVDGQMAWHDDDSLGQYVVELTIDDVSEVERALAHFLNLSLDVSEVNPATFPLPNLQGQLTACALELHDGRGICVLRGIDPNHYSDDDNTIIFLGVASHVGDRRGTQTADGDILEHVYEPAGWALGRDAHNGIHTNRILPFHNDMGTDLVAFHVRRVAENGGEINVASSAAVYNTMMDRDAWAVREMVAPEWPMRVVQCEAGAARHELVALLSVEGERVAMSVDEDRLGPHYTESGVPRLRGVQRDALAVLQSAAGSNGVRIVTQAGDIVIFNNWGVMHAEAAYIDRKTSTHHLIRLWLRNERLSWDTPQCMRVAWDSAFGRHAVDGHRGFAVVPARDYVAPKSSNGSAGFDGWEDYVVDGDHNCVFAMDDDNDDNGGDEESRIRPGRECGVEW